MSIGNWVKALGLGLAMSIAAQADEQGTRRDGERRDGERPAASSEVRRASLIVGHNLMNGQDEKLGTIKDIVIDSKGHAKYVIVDCGGVLAEKYIAVPWNAVNPRFGADHCVLNMSVDKFTAAPNFLLANYYERWTPEWCQKVHAYFGDDKAKSTDANRADATRTDANRAERKSEDVYYTSQLIGGTVQNKDNKKLASIDDVVFDNMNRATYFVIGSGGILNIGKSQIAVPFSAAALKKGERGTAFAILDVTPQQLEGAPTLAKDDYRDLLDRDFMNNTNRFFGVTGARQEIEAETPVERRDNP